MICEAADADAIYRVPTGYHGRINSWLYKNVGHATGMPHTHRVGIILSVYACLFQDYFADGLALALDVEAGGEAVSRYFNALEVEVFNWCVLVSDDAADA